MRLRDAPSSGVTSQSGQMLIETIVAIMIFSIIAVSGVAVLSGSVVSHKVSRQKTLAEQLALQEMEKIRQLPYTSVGLTTSYPTGTLSASTTIPTTVGLVGTITRSVTYVDDPANGTPYVTRADYKRVTVTITATDGKVLTTQTTFVSPFDASSYGGPNVGTLQVTVQDMGNQAPLPNVTVSIAGGPSPSATDATDASGVASFPALTQNPSSGSTRCYEITITPPAGYAVYPPDAPASCGSSPADAIVTAGQTTTPTIRIYKAASVTFNVTRFGAPYTPSTSVTLKSTLPTPYGAKTYGPYTVTNGTLTVPANFAASPLPTFLAASGLSYTATATSGALTAVPQTLPIPDTSYPAASTQTFTLAFTDTTVTVKKKTSTGACSVDTAATVEVTGGPNGVDVTQTTDSSGKATFDLLPGPNYTVTVTSPTRTAAPLTAQVVSASPTLTNWAVTTLASGATGTCP